MTTSEYIKEHTKQYHGKIENVMNSEQIFQPDYSRDDYFKFLNVQLQFLEMFEEKVFDLLQPEWNDTLQLPLRKKLAVLKNELYENGQKNESATAPFSAPLSKMQALGILYVSEGSSLGGNVIRKALQKNAAFHNHDFQFLNCYGDKTGEMWKQLTGFLNGCEENREEILDGALLAYRNLIRIAIEKYYPAVLN